MNIRELIPTLIAIVIISVLASDCSRHIYGDGTLMECLKKYGPTDCEKLK